MPVLEFIRKLGLARVYFTKTKEKIRKNKTLFTKVIEK